MKKLLANLFVVLGVFSLPAVLFASIFVYQDSWVTIDLSYAISPLQGDADVCFVFTSSGGSGCNGSVTSGVYTNLRDAVATNAGQSSSTLTASGLFCFSAAGGGGCTPTVSYRFVDGAMYEPALVTLLPQVNAIDWPRQFSVSTTTSQFVSFSYLNTVQYDVVGLEVIDQSNNFLVVRTGQQQAQFNTSATYSTVFSLQPYHAYRFRGFLASSAASSTATYGPYVDFSSLADQFFTSTSTLLNISSVTESNASSTANTGLNQFTNIPAYLSQRVPFGYIFAIRDIYLNTSTTSSEFSAIHYNLGDTNISTGTRAYLPGNIDVLSTTTVTRYLNGTLLAAFNALVSAMLFVGLMYEFWWRIHRIHLHV